MSGLVIGHDEAVAGWVSGITGVPFHPPYSAIGIESGGRLTGAFVFTGFNGAGIDLSVAGQGIAGRDAWRAALHYVFVQCGCVRLQMHTRKSNKRVCRILGKFLPRRSYEGISRRYYGDEDGVCFALTADDLPAFKAKWGL